MLPFPPSRVLSAFQFVLTWAILMTSCHTPKGKGFGSADAGSYGAAADGDGSGSVGVTILA